MAQNTASNSAKWRAEGQRTKPAVRTEGCRLLNKLKTDSFKWYLVRLLGQRTVVTDRWTAWWHCWKSTELKVIVCLRMWMCHRMQCVLLNKKEQRTAHVVLTSIRLSVCLFHFSTESLDSFWSVSVGLVCVPDHKNSQTQTQWLNATPTSRFVSLCAVYFSFYSRDRQQTAMRIKS